MDFLIGSAGILGTFFSIATFFIPDKWKSKRITIFLFVLVTSILSYFLADLNSKLNRIQKVSKAAKMLSEKRSTEFTHRGFSQACLTFLEQNKDLYPDTYQRAVIAFEKYQESHVVELDYELWGMVKGIAILNETSEEN